MNISESASVLLVVICLSLAGCDSFGVPHSALPKEGEDPSHHATESPEGSHSKSHEEGGETHKIIVTTPLKRDIVSTQPYVCQIHSCKHIEVRALNRGYLEAIYIKEGQAVEKNAPLFKILAILYQARLDTDIAEARRIQIELDNARALNVKGIVSPQEVALKEAELAKANAKVALARAELNFTNITAPFSGIVDRQRSQLGSLIEEGEVLTTLSDNSLMWVYFNVPEARYLEYKQDLDKGDQAERLQIELRLANGHIFPAQGKLDPGKGHGAIEADFNNTTGNIAFRADFENPQGLLRNGQTGTVLIHRALKGVLIVPQRATFEILDKRYAYVVDDKKVVHQRDITIASEQDDIFVIDKGLEETDQIIFEGIRQVRDGETISYDFVAPAELLTSLKFPAQ